MRTAGASLGKACEMMLVLHAADQAVLQLYTLLVFIPPRPAVDIASYIHYICWDVKNWMSTDARRMKSYVVISLYVLGK